MRLERKASRQGQLEHRAKDACSTRVRYRLVLLALLAFPATAFAYGEPDADGLPNHKERLLHVLTNQLRQAPHEWPDWDTSLASDDPRPPVAHSPGLAEAARFHADDMKANGCFTHESCDGTTFNARVARYFNGAGASENLYSAFADKSERSAITGWMNSTMGHRENMLMSEWTLLGVGWSETATQIWFVQDFGFTTRPEIPLIPVGAMERRGNETLLHATFYDPEGRAPGAMIAMVDGAEIAMEHMTGPAGNETWSATIDTPEDCSELYFTARDDAGDEGRYPTEGALLFGPDCTSEYTATAKPPDNRPIIDADEDGGCTALTVRGQGGLEVLLLALIAVAARRRDR